VSTVTTPVATPTLGQSLSLKLAYVLVFSLALSNVYFWREYVHAVKDVHVVVPGVIPGPGPGIPARPTTIGNLRVLILYESSANMTAAQLTVINSTKVRTYLNTHCLADGSYPAWRSWDQNVDAARDTADWQAALKVGLTDAKTLPKFLIYAGTTLVDSIPLPATEDAALAALQVSGGK
jgi:hypothetical protein